MAEDPGRLPGETNMAPDGSTVLQGPGAGQDPDRAQAERARLRDEREKAAAKALAAYASPPDSVGPTDIPAASGGPDATMRINKQIEAWRDGARDLSSTAEDGTDNEPHCEEDDGALPGDKMRPPADETAAERAARERQAAGTPQAATVTGRKAAGKTTT